MLDHRKYIYLFEPGIKLLHSASYLAFRERYKTFEG
jgi:hypothetical protein